MTHARRDLGQRGEALAAAYLMGLGMRLDQRNVRTRTGEIDLIAEHGHDLVFVEVRSRRRSHHFKALDAFNERKRRQVRRTVRDYLDRVGFTTQRPVRIDVVAVTFETRGATIEHIANAF